MKAKKMDVRKYQFNNIEDKQGNYIYPTCYGNVAYRNDKEGFYRTLDMRFPDAVKLLFGRTRK